MLLAGAFDTTGGATLRVKVAGGGPQQEYVATIDTGFTGFIAMPVSEMVPLRLKTDGATTVTLGDGSVVDNLVAQGSVTLGNQTVGGPILLDESSGDVLVGMDFLRRFKLGLIVTQSVILLYDEAETLATVLRFMEHAPAGEPNVNPPTT